MTRFRLAGVATFALVAALFLAAVPGNTSPLFHLGNNTERVSTSEDAPEPIDTNGEAAPQPDDDDEQEAPAETLLRYELPVFPESLRFTGTTESTVRIDVGRKPVTLSPRASATTEFEVRPLGRDEGRNRVGFAIVGLSFQYRDEQHSLGFSLGSGRGPGGVDGLTTTMDGQAGRVIPQLDWGGDATQLPPTFGEVIGTGRLSPSAGLRNIASRLPESDRSPAFDPADDSRSSLLIYQNPAEIAALYYLPLPHAPLETLADENGIATWNATVALPPLYGEPAREIELRFETNIANRAGAPLTITFAPANSEAALALGQTLSGRITIDPNNPGTLHTITYKLTHQTPTEAHKTTWRIAPK